MNPTEEVGIFYLGYILPVSMLAQEVQRESATLGGQGAIGDAPLFDPKTSMAIPVSLLPPYCSRLQWSSLCDSGTRSIHNTKQENTVQRLLHPIKMFYYLSFLSCLCN